MANPSDPCCFEILISFKTMREELSELLSRDATVVKAAGIYDFNEPCRKEFKQFLSHLCHLESFFMEGIGHNITDYYLKIIGGKLKKLRDLKIAWNTSITDVGLSYLSGENDLIPEVARGK